MSALASEVLAFMSPQNPGLGAADGEAVEIAHGMGIQRVDIALACARYFHALGPERETPAGEIAYAYVAGVVAGAAVREGTPAS